MNTKRFFKLSVVILAGLFIFSSCTKDEVSDTMVDAQPGLKSVVEIATSNNDFTILVDALAKADLVNALDGDGPYTVFAPTNSAFENLFNKLGVNGIEDLSAEALTPILLNHVVSAQAESSSLISGYVSTLNTFTPDMMGADVYIEVDGTKSLTRGEDAETGEISQKVSKAVKINGSVNVIIADVLASNGVIHIIDEVILPSSVVDFALSNPNFSTLVEAVVKADLVEALSAAGPFTVFAPTNQAFAMLFNELGVNGIQDIPAETLKPILLYHVIGDNVISTEVGKGSVPTLNADANIEIDIVDSKVMLNTSAQVIAVDVQGTNGVIHVIDKVLIP
jgi:transforming growth factor-beta-induced protein